MYGAAASVPSQAITPLGYDGQFYYYIARDPGVLAACAHKAPTCPLDSLREVRSGVSSIR